ncbi:DnaJ domain-containing protein [Thermodesulfatator autotrophicus]|uniref:Molecular chaperone DnaJ n=1 Tax=Thermodesulfatator autotrophicus TaxID=1795632 RepID=A0A177E810_9BACT|nr:DnaJ domain-containing protein [Thermodesulfatator autotrophicus]OAG27631.1 molecular chaperone DnaJ [Thermodesulfatator autotrophicus]
MARNKWQKIEEARKLLKLPLQTTRAEIRARYRKLAAEFHPDKKGDTQSMQRLNEAYHLLMDYCEHYLIDLRPNDQGADAEDWWFLHFGEDPVWRGKKEED